jgi:hypothetical protein
MCYDAGCLDSFLFISVYQHRPLVECIVPINFVSSKPHCRTDAAPAILMKVYRYDSTPRASRCFANHSMVGSCDRYAAHSSSGKNCPAVSISPSRACLAVEPVAIKHRTCSSNLGDMPLCASACFTSHALFTSAAKMTRIRCLKG